MVCFSISEAEAINDTLWRGVDRRRAFAVLSAMYARAEKAGKEAEADLSVAREALKRCRLAEEVERKGRESAEGEAKDERRRGKARFWTGVVLGGVGAALGTYGVLRAVR